MKRWAMGYDRCQSCGTAEFKHAGKGLCITCYSAAADARLKSHITRKRGSRLLVPITEDELRQKYDSGMSFTDLARHYNCTRQYIHKVMRQYGIARRTLSEASSLALQQGKVSYSYKIGSPVTSIIKVKRTVDESFFKTWTPAMAWVLGVIYTDGCLHGLRPPGRQSRSAKMGKLRFRELIGPANCGDVTAQFNLAAKYEHGVQALKWYILAADGGDEGAAVARDELLKKMSRVQIAEARQQAQDWAPQEKVIWRLSISQKEPELLEKVRTLMGSNALLRFSKKRGIAGALYTLMILNATICADLIRLGLTAAKSLTISFPHMPARMVRHFIRGCWDGDGSVYLEGNDRSKPCASYGSGSKKFIESLVRQLVDFGLPSPTIHKLTRSKNPHYYFRYTGLPCARLYHVLYDDVDESLYLARNHDRFKQIADDFERPTSQELRALLGDVSAQLNLARMYRDGFKVLRDYVQAYRWSSLAAQHGNDDAATMRDELAKQMSPRMLAQAQGLAKEWKSKKELEMN